MLKAKQHIIPLLLAGILCFPALSFLYFKVQEKLVQHEMLEKMEHAELQKITLHNNSVNWYKNEKEIIINSTLFDVHQYSVINDSTVFIGLFDTSETELKNRVKKLFEEKGEESQSRDVIITKLMLQLWILYDDNKDLNLPGCMPDQSKHSVDYNNLLYPAISIPSPPPKS
jgi:hypothetical protein